MIPFPEQTDAQQRITLAHEVLKLIQRPNFQASWAMYILVKTENFTIEGKLHAFAAGASCEACALGSLAIGVALQYPLSLANWPTRGPDFKTQLLVFLSSYFDIVELMSIEDAFMADAIDLSNTLRLAAIMHNIIANSGTFIREQLQ